MVTALWIVFSLGAFSAHAEGNFTGEPYEIHLRDADLGAVLHMICTQTGLNLVMASNQATRKRISGDFTDRWDATLEGILKKNGLTYRVTDKIYFLVGRSGEALLDPALESIAKLPVENPISLNVTNASLSDVVTILVNEVLAPAKLDLDGLPLRGYVTVEALEVPAKKLLQLVLATNGYGLEEHDGGLKLNLLPGFELPERPEEGRERKCDRFACTDLSNIRLRGTISGSAEGATPMALFEFADGEYLLANTGRTLGPTARVGEVTPYRVNIRDGGASVKTEVIFRMDEASPAPVR
jgi:hypothetical protein